MPDPAHHLLHSHAAARPELPLQNGRGDSCTGDAGGVVGAWCGGHQATGQQSSSVHLLSALPHAVHCTRLWQLSMLWPDIKVITSCVHISSQDLPSGALHEKCEPTLSSLETEDTHTTSIALLHLVQPAIHLDPRLCNRSHQGTAANSSNLMVVVDFGWAEWIQPMCRRRMGVETWCSPRTPSLRSQA